MQMEQDYRKEKPKTSDYAVYDLADIGTRFMAQLIDGFLLGLIAGALFGVTRGAAPFLWFLFAGLYNWYFWTRQSGQTPGKMAMGIRVIKADGTAISDTDAVIRFIGYYINSFIVMLGWLWAFVDNNRQGLHDKLASTYVVRA